MACAWAVSKALRGKKRKRFISRFRKVVSDRGNGGKIIGIRPPPSPEQMRLAKVEAARLLRPVIAALKAEDD